MRVNLLLGITAICTVAGWAGEVPRKAPPLQVMTPVGETVSLENYRGKVLLLKFFLTDCAHCQRSAGHIMPIYKEWRSRGLEVLSVAINPDALQRIPEFVQRFGVSYPIALGNRNTLTTFADLSAVARFFVPYIFLIDRRGVIRYEHAGGDKAFYDNEAQNLRTEIDLLLREPASVSKASAKSPRKG